MACRYHHVFHTTGGQPIPHLSPMCVSNQDTLCSGCMGIHPLSFHIFFLSVDRSATTTTDFNDSITYLKQPGTAPETVYLTPSSRSTRSNNYRMTLRTLRTLREIYSKSNRGQSPKPFPHYFRTFLSCLIQLKSGNNPFFSTTSYMLFIEALKKASATRPLVLLYSFASGLSSISEVMHSRRLFISAS